MFGVIVSILALGFIIFIHELGHFLFAKLFGVGVVEFALGMGPRLFSFVKGETRYSLRALPLGGACMMLGEEDAEKETSDADDKAVNLRVISNGGTAEDSVCIGEDSITVDGREFSKDQQFYSKEAWKRFLIIFAGPLFNFILAFLLSLIVTVNVGWDHPIIYSVTPGYPAEIAGIEEGDTVRSLSIEGRKTNIMTARDMQLFFTANEKLIASGSPVTIEFTKKDGTDKMSTMTAVYDEEHDSWLFGLSYKYFYEKCDNLWDILKISFNNIIYCFRSTIESIRMMVRGEVSGSDVKGVVGMVAIMDENVEEAYQYGLSDAVLTLLDIMLLLSASLGLMNLLPLPALDGGRLVFILIEMITGKAVPKKIEGIIHAVGTVFLLVLMMIVMFNDVWNLIK